MKRDYPRLIQEAWGVAELAHQYQAYDIFPYTKHLRDVVRILEENGFVNDYILSGILHDIIEDCNISYNKIKTVFGLNVAEMVFAVTDPKARNRREKKEKVYDDIRAYPKSIIIKLADRIANIENSIQQRNWDKLKMYLKESDDFRMQLFDSTPEDGKILWDVLYKTIETADEMVTMKRITKA
jgi:GTP pyrophosphokinase